MTLRKPALTWVLAKNEKTGPVPSAYVGATREEARRSCRGCPLLEKGCYAWKGTPNMGFASIERATDHGNTRRNEYTLDAVLARLDRKRKGDAVRVVRLGALGDPGRAKLSEIRAVVRAATERAMLVLGYTHHAAESDLQVLRHTLMASCDSLEEADRARGRGWRPAVVLKHEEVPQGPFAMTPKGRKLLVCPAQRKDAVTCNSCGLCSPQHPMWQKRTNKVAGIAFIPHGPLRKRLPMMKEEDCHVSR